MLYIVDTEQFSRLVLNTPNMPSIFQHKVIKDLQDFCCDFLGNQNIQVVGNVKAQFVKDYPIEESIVDSVTVKNLIDYHLGQGDMVLVWVNDQWEFVFYEVEHSVFPI